MAVNEHHGHSHTHTVDASTNTVWLTVALALNIAFMVAEVIFAVVSGSLALLSDAAHMLTDVVAIAFALVAARLASRPPSGGYTYGLKRTEILSAQLNGLLMLLLAAFIVVGSVRDLINPQSVAGGYVVVVGLLGALINGAAALALSRANRSSLNVEGAFLHNLMDLYASLAAVAAGVIIVATGFMRADSLAALAVCLVMLRGGWSLLRDSSRVLLEAAPRGIDPDQIGRSLIEQVDVVEVHDLHVWELTSGFAALSAHVVVADGVDCHRVRQVVETVINQRFGISHITLQVDHEPQRLIAIQPLRPSSS